MHTHSIIGCGKDNLASSDVVEDIEVPTVFVTINWCYTLKDSKVLSTPITRAEQLIDLIDNRNY